MIGAEASAVPAFLVISMRVRREQHAARFERRVEIPQYARQFPARHMKKRRVGEHAIKTAGRQIQREKILLPHFAAAVCARHFNKAGGAFEADRNVAQLAERHEIATRTATEIEHGVRRRPLDGMQQRRDVLA